MLDVAYIGGGQGTMAAKGGQRRIPRRILVVSLDNLGDLVFASALLPPLRESFPSAYIGVWCKEYASGLGPLLPVVDVIYSADPFWDQAPGGRKGSFRAFVATALAVRRARFDTALLCFAPWRTAAAVAATGIPVRIGLERRRNQRWLTEILPAEERHKPVLSEVARLLEPLGAGTTDLRYRLDASASESDRALAELSLSDTPFVALHPFAGSQSRCVELSHWLRTAEDLSSLGLAIFWIGTPKELQQVRETSIKPERWRYSDTLRGSSLTLMAQAISAAKLFMGHDSGPLHIAAALGVPSIGVFAPGEPTRTFPQGRAKWRLIARSSPLDVTADDMIREARSMLQSV
jgi:ADP-heptose:LPS heptosyltransferase